MSAQGDYNSEAEELTFLPPMPDQNSPSRHSISAGTEKTADDRRRQNQGTVLCLSQIQRYSSYAFALFTTVHFTNTALIPLFSRHSSPSVAVSSADSYLLLTRPLYQSPINEVVLIVAPLGLHILSGLGLRLYRRHLKVRRDAQSREDNEEIEYLTSASDTELGKEFGPALGTQIKTKETKGRSQTILGSLRKFMVGLTEGWPAISGVSSLGYLLTPCLLGHVLMNRITPLLTSPSSSSRDFGLDGSSSIVGLEFIAHGFSKHPLFATVGYSCLIAAASWHIVWGWARWLKMTPPPGTIRSIVPSWAIPVRSSSRWGVNRRAELNTSSTLSMSARRNRNQWLKINGAAALMAGVWCASAFGVVARAGPAEGWVAREFDRLYQGIPIVGAFL